MIKYHKDLVAVIPPLDENTVIWRYMPFWKFQYLIEKQALYFTKMEKLQQQEELTITEKDAYNYRLSKDGLMAVCERDRKRYFINCWSIADEEEQSMWDKFVPGDGIAIITTVGALMKSDMQAGLSICHLFNILITGKKASCLYLNRMSFG